MGTPENKLSDLVDIVKSWSWIPRRGEPPYLSRDFWMPDQSCLVCYECDSQFTVFNRRHHCRLCGRVFCAKCTANSVPAPSDEPRIVREDSERIRVCHFCFKQWEQRIATVEKGVNDPTPGLSPSPSALSLASAKSGCTCNSSSSSSSVGSTPYSTGPYHHVNYNSSNNPHMPSQMNTPLVKTTTNASERSTNPDAGGLDSSNHFGFFTNRSDDEDDDYGDYRTDSEARPYTQDEDYYGAINIDEIEKIYGSDKVHLEAENTVVRAFSGLSENLDAQGVDGAKKLEDVGESDNIDICSASGYDVEGADAEPVDFENNGLLWLPPEPENEEDEKEVALFDDDEEDGATGEWGYLRSSNSFGSGEYRSRDKSSEEHKRAMKNVVEGHFRALIAQLLQVENLSMSDEDSGESWLDIVTSLSWEAATHLKPDTSKGGGMDPGGYAKVKCIASGRRSESVVIKGVVCKKNVAHRRMTSKIDKPRFLALGGALEYQRVANHLSSFDTLLQQEMDHLKMAVAKIDVHQPNVLLVEKSVSRHAQEFLLAKDISLVLNIKRPLLERIARCTGAQIVPSIDHLTSPKLGHCDLFHVEKFLEEHGSAGQGGKKLMKTLMFFEGCPKPHGCTILLKGANGDELKKVKHVVQYGVFAAYHLALETSFLADERASLPELPLKSPITVALPDKPSSIDRSISTIPGFNTLPAGQPITYQHSKEVENSSKDHLNGASSSELYADSDWTVQHSESSPSSYVATAFNVFRFSPQKNNSQVNNKMPSEMHSSGMDNEINSEESFQENTSITGELMVNGMLTSNFQSSERAILGNVSGHLGADVFKENQKESLVSSFSKQDVNNNNEEAGCAKEEFPPSPSEHQSILVSLSTRCVWKGTVCERAHLFRIKYYGSFDKPLGRFLRDHLFDQGLHCHSCDMPSEAHVHCYTHRQGSLTISVKKLPDFHLPGEREGKIWMWHRCLRCPRNNGFPPATRRVVMSDAAWGLSFGKFLELSFSNHAAASRVASCGHSLHRDCLRFYGFGRMVACFRYASIDVLSVYLPPSKLEFNYDIQEWIQREAKEVTKRAELLYDEVYDALKKMLGKLESSGLPGDDMKISEQRAQFEELEELLQKDKDEIQGSLKKVLYKDVKVGQPSVDILELNKLRRQILFLSYIWDQRLVNASGLATNNLAESKSNSLPKPGLKSANSVEKLGEMNRSPRPFKASNNVDSVLVEAKPEVKFSQGATFGEMSMPVDPKEMTLQPEPNNGNDIESTLSFGANTTRKLDPGESVNVRRIHSESEVPVMESLSDTLEAAWTGESHPPSIKTKENGYPIPDSTSADQFTMVKALVTPDVDNQGAEQTGLEGARSLPSSMSIKGPDCTEKPTHWTSLPSLSFQGSLNNNSVFNSQKLVLNESNPVYVPSFREMERKSGARLLLPVGINDTVVPVYDDEPTSIIAYALVSPEYHTQISESDRAKDISDASVSLPLLDSVGFLSVNYFEDASSDTYRSFGSGDESMLSLPGSRGSQNADPLPYSKDLHARVSFNDDSPHGKVKYTVTCYYAKRFEALRRTCCPSELDFIRSLSRCKKWGAQGGKSNVFFAKTLDDRFIIKQVTKTELESFIKFGPEYFKYLSESIGTGSPTCLAKILGIYQVSAKHVKGGKESKMDVLVMENLLFKRNVTRLYDLKGSSRSRYNPDTSGNNKVLLDQNLIEAMPTSPIFVGSKAKRLLERAVWNDTNFLALIDVMDYSLLVGVDEEKHELVLGIIDFMRQYTWDKHLESWVKTSGILGGPRNTSPTVISPQQYKKRFRKAMTAYFLMMPDQWSPPLVPSKTQTDLCEENPIAGTPQE